MNDYEIVKAYNEEPEPIEEEEKGGGAIDLIKAPNLPSEPLTAPVKVNVGEKAAETIDKAKNQKGLLSTTIDTKNKGKKILGSAVPSLEDMPTPPSGGIGLLLFIALLMVFAITPVAGSGMTRLSLLWQALLGNYSIQSGGSAGSSSGSGSSGSQSSPLPSDPLNPSWYIQGAN